MSRAEEADIRTGVLGLDPRTHLASFLAVGVAAMLVTGLLETALLQAIAAAYLAANGRPKLAASAELRGIEIGEGRTSVYHVGLSARDAACAFLVVVSAAAVYALGVAL